MENELKQVFEHLKNNHNIKPKDLYEKIGVTTNQFNNAVRKGSHGTRTSLLLKIKEIYTREMDNFGKTFANEKEQEKFLLEQIAFYKEQNAILREENRRMLDKILDGK